MIEWQKVCGVVFIFNGAMLQLQCILFTLFFHHRHMFWYTSLSLYTYLMRLKHPKKHPKEQTIRRTTEKRRWFVVKGVGNVVI